MPPTIYLFIAAVTCLLLAAYLRCELVSELRAQVIFDRWGIDIYRQSEEDMAKFDYALGVSGYDQFWKIWRPLTKEEWWPHWYNFGPDDDVLL